MVLLFYTTYISVDLAYHEIFSAIVGKGGITCLAQGQNTVTPPAVSLELATPFDHYSTALQTMLYKMVNP